MSDLPEATNGRISGEHLCACPEDKYENLLAEKLQTLSSLFPTYPREDIDVFRSPVRNFRNRSNFIVWRDKRGDNSPDALFYGMYESPSGVSEATPGTAGRSKKEKRDERLKNQLSPKPIRQIMEITSFPRGTVLMDRIMQELMLYVRGKVGPGGDVPPADEARSLLRREMFEVRIVTTQTQQAIVVLLYHCPLDTAKWCAAARGLLEWLRRPELGAASGDDAIRIVARARRQKLYVSSTHSSATDPPEENPYAEKVTLPNLEKEMIAETYCVSGERYLNYQIEGAFSQPNASVCEHMLKWSQDCTGIARDHGNPNNTSAPTDEDLVELYCGGGTFTAPLSRNFRSVLATELSKASVVLAKKSFADNNITNITIAPMSAESFSDLYTRYISGNHIKGEAGTKGNEHGNAQFRWDNIEDFDNISTAFVDPPRAGCDEATCALLAKFDKICYISCNPETLARDVKRITECVGPGTSSATSSSGDKSALYRHKIVRMAAFDQFPYTHHLESGVMLVKHRLKESEVAQVQMDHQPQVGEKRKASG